MIAGYARTDATHPRPGGGEEGLDGQIETLSAAGVQRIWAETSSTRSRDRPELARLLDTLGPEDVLVVTGYDRLSRSLIGLAEIVETLRHRGAGFRSLAENVDTTDRDGRAVFHVFSTIAEFERARISARTREGLAAARKLGRVGGRPPALSPQQKIEVRRMRDVEGRRISEIARLFNVSANTVRRA